MPAPMLARSSLTVALIAIVAVAAAIASFGAGMFSPGGLHAGDSTTVVMGGVTSHAELTRECASCHAGPMSGTTMRALCVQCHTDIQEELTDSTSLHGAFAATGRCTSCHIEHAGPDANLTRFDGLGAEHARFGFPLDGAHAKVECAQCHAPAGGEPNFRDTPKTCVGCHELDDTHKGSYGTDCASCHNTTNWEDATFEHDIFPIDHGAEEQRSTCKTCHTDTSNYKVYTCFGCHEHTPANIEREHRGEVNRSDISDCVSCHEGGSEHGERGRGERREGGRRDRDDDDGTDLATRALRELRPSRTPPDPLRSYLLTWRRA